jgi:hypothetical protein
MTKQILVDLNLSNNLQIGKGWQDPIEGCTLYRNGDIFTNGEIKAAKVITALNNVNYYMKTATPTENTAGYHLNALGYGVFSRSQAIPFYINRYGQTSGTIAFAQFIYNGTNNGVINIASGGTPAFASGSDYRMKTNITPITDALERMKKAKAYTFYKINEVDPSNTLHTGFLAHELFEVQPDSVVGEKNAVDEEGKPIYQEVMESKIIPVMAQAINDLISKVEKLESQLEELLAK